MICIVSAQAMAAPIYIKLRIGIKAKWQVTTGDCSSGKGLCLSVGGLATDNDLVYDAATGDLAVHVYSTTPEYAELIEPNVEFEFDTPIDPALNTHLGYPAAGTVYIDAGMYPVMDDGSTKVVSLNYHYEP